MATSGKINGKSTGTATSLYDLWVDWKRNSYSIENNTSNITIYLRVKRNDGYAGSFYNLEKKPSVALKVGGASKTPTINYIDTRNSATSTIATWTGNVTHNADGSLSLSINASFTTSGSNAFTGGSVSGTASIDSIPRASVPTLSASSVVMGNTVTITTNRKSDSFTHDLTYKFNGYEGTIKSGVGESYKWTVPDLVSKIPNKSSGTCTIYCKTKSGSTVVGTKSVSLTLKIPAKSTPTFSKTSVRMGTSVTINTNRKSSGYTHKITYKFGDASGTIGTGTTSSKSWTPSKTLVNETNKQLSGTCTITCETYNGTLSVGTSTATVTLTVPSATVPTLSDSSVVMDEIFSITMTKEVDAYTHDLTYSLVGKGSSTVVATGTILTGVSGEYSWSVPLSLASKIPSATEGTITITCKTRFKESTTVVGEEKVSLTVTVPYNNFTKPDFTIGRAAIHSLSSAFSTVFVQGRSQIQISYTEKDSAYSTIASYKTEILGKTINGNPCMSDVLNTAGTVTIKSTATDARGFSTTKTFDIEVISYAKPRITPGEGENSIICTRCNSDGTLDGGGVFILIKIGRKYSTITSGGSQKNYCKLSYQYKADSEDKYCEPIEILSRDGSSDYVSKKLTDREFPNTVAYNFKLIAEDDVGEKDTVDITVPTAFAVWHSPPGGHGFTLGGYHDKNKYDVFDCKFDAEFEGNVSGRVLGMGALPEIEAGKNFNDYKEFGVFAVTQNSTGVTALNRPTEKAGTLRVWSANGTGLTTEGYVYIMQEYITYDNSETYRRNMTLRPSSDWEYGEWKEVPCFEAGITAKSGVAWYWRKYTDGTAECRGRKTNKSRDVATQFGNMYYADCDEVEFPFSFYSPPIVNATVESGSALILMSWQGTDGNGTTTATKPASYRVIRPTTITGASFTISYHAIGRWKE